MIEPVIIGNATLYCGDCRDVLPLLSGIDAVIADPPYGIGLEYGDYIDSAENLKELIPDFVKMCIDISPLVSISSGNVNHYFYPKPTWTLCWFNRAGSGSGPWGFSCWQPILVYGADPYLATGKGRRPDFIEHSETSEKETGHPCPKPTLFMQKWIERVAFNATTILDPFMGSGTTGIACMNLSKKFVGIEIEPKYFDIACKRIEQAQAQQRLFA